ncbi:hypothetical protein [Asaia astilbis]|uniref:hypothetical protein n=1 Tax=Asaia astilbis TaxID=610244 RepID=UPI0006862DCB|nr:hypothetical protein [Asaia astilbis]
MNDEKPDWRDEKTGEGDGYDRPRSTGGGERRSSDPRFTDTRPPSYGSDSVSASREGARSSSARERLSADYDDEPVFRRRSAGGGLSAVLGSDVMTRRLVYGAAGLGALLVVGVGGWSLLGGHSGGIPVIGPPPGPVRDRPADPGGMQIMSGGADLDVTGKGEAHLAPEPEQPRLKRWLPDQPPRHRHRPQLQRRMVPGVPSHRRVRWRAILSLRHRLRPLVTRLIAIRALCSLRPCLRRPRRKSRLS